MVQVENTMTTVSTSPHVLSQVATPVELPLAHVALQLGGAVHGAHVVGNVRASAEPEKCFKVG